MSSNIPMTEDAKEIATFVKFGKLAYAGFKIDNVIINGEKVERTVPAFTGPKGLDKLYKDDEKSGEKVLKKLKKKLKASGSRDEFLDAVYGPFVEAMTSLRECGGYGCITLEFKDSSGNWNDKAVLMSYADDAMPAQKKMLVGSNFGTIKGAMGGFKACQTSCIADVEDYCEILGKVGLPVPKDM